MPVVGDPHVEALDGTTFDFVGVPHRLHTLYSRGPLRVLARLTPVGWTREAGDPPDETRQYLSWIHIVVGDVEILVGADGKTHVVMPDHHFVVEAKVDTLDAPGHPGSTSDEPHPLQNIPHLNLTHPRMPAHRLGEGGILVDGAVAARTPGLYVVDG